MDITKLSFAARSRTAHETFDLTLLMVKENFVPMMKIVISLYLPLIILMWLIFSVDVASFIIWWLKPLLERPVLTYLANKSFSVQISTWQCIRSIKQLVFSDMIKMLTIYRLSPNRAYLSPIEQLERAQGKVQKQRKNAMLIRGKHKQTYWMFLCVHFELIILSLLMLAAYNFIPNGISVDEQFAQMNFDSALIMNTYYFAYAVAIMLVAPYFVTGGFLAYINMRIQLEAWDLELAFKRIASRFSAVALTLCLSFSLFFAYTPQVAAEQTSSSNTEMLSELSKDWQAPIIENQQILADSEQGENVPSSSAQLNDLSEEQLAEQQRQAFDQTHEEVEAIYQDNNLIESASHWQPHLEEKKNDVEDWDDFLLFLASLGNLIAYLLWGIAFVLAVWLIVKFFQYLENSELDSYKIVRGDKQQKIALPTFFADVEQKSWPKDLLSSAKQATEAKEFRLALTYLLQFALTLALEKTAVVITASMTEQECARALQSELLVEDFSHYQRLINTWCQLAWAHRSVEAEQIMQMIQAFAELEQRGVRNEQNT